MVKSNGDIMEALYNRREDASTDERKVLTEDLLQNISYSIKEELENSELVEIDEQINNLIMTARKFKAQNLTTSDTQINKLISMLNEKIEENKTELKSQQELIGFYNKEQKTINKKSQLVNDKLKKYNTKSNVNDKNYQIIKEKTNNFNK